jgi:hypothetical protein
VPRVGGGSCACCEEVHDTDWVLRNWGFVSLDLRLVLGFPPPRKPHHFARARTHTQPVPGSEVEAYTAGSMANIFQFLIHNRRYSKQVRARLYASVLSVCLHVLRLVCRCMPSPVCVWVGLALPPLCPA